MISREDSMIPELCIEKERLAKRNIRDSIFTKLFSSKINVFELYRTIHPEDKEVRVVDIDIVTLELVLTNGMHNDLGFSVRGNNGRVKKIILVEAQTKWDKNMAERMSTYAQKTREKHWIDYGQGYYQNDRMNTPVFEHYMIYTGEEDHEGEYMMLHDGIVPRESMNLGLRVITKVDDTICGQYIGFCKVYSDRLKNQKDKSKILEETINICIEKNYLRKFFQENLKEVKNIMGLFMDQALAVESYARSEKRKGREEGRIEGRIETAQNIIRTMFRNKKQIEAQAKIMNMPIKEYIYMFAKNVDIEQDIFIELCAQNLGMTIENYKNEYLC